MGAVDSGQGVCIGCQRPLSDDEAYAQIRDQQEKSDALRKAYDAAQDTAKTLTQELNSLRTRIEEARRAVGTAREAVREAQRNESQAERNVDLIQHELATAESVASTLKDRQQALADTTATLTTARSEEAALAREVATLRTRAIEIRNSVEQARATVEQSHKTASLAHRNTDALQRELNDTQALASTLEERKKAATKAATALTEAQATAEKFGDEPKRDEKRHETLKAALDKATKELEATRGGEERRKQITQERASVRDRARRLWQEQQRRSQVATELTSLQAPLEKAEASVKELTEKSETYGVLMDAFKPSGIPFMILSGVIEELNEEANEIISELGDDGLSVLITTASENKNGGTAEKVMVYAVTSDGQANYSALSGSEQTRVALAIRLGLAQCIARRTGTPIQTIVADECWGMFDDEGKRALMNVFIRLSERFSVFSVSHIPDVTDAFPDAIEVDMSTGTSRATVRAGR
ncbi:tropomyosin-like [Tenebrio molitor]|uniref:tropomyosin-like n=1 Tax=Tenebrio molitor TaxID=7067 RepID=UPI0036247C03